MKEEQNILEGLPANVVQMAQTAAKVAVSDAKDICEAEGIFLTEDAIEMLSHLAATQYLSGLVGATHHILSGAVTAKELNEAVLLVMKEAGGELVMEDFKNQETPRSKS